MAIGYSKTGGTNISSSASQFAKTDHILQYTQPPLNDNKKIDEGTEKGAFRHALWQATIMSRYGYNIARQVGDAHENNAEVDLSQRAFDNYSEADTVVDLLNKDGTWSVNRTKITEEQYEQMKETFLIIDEYGRKKQE